MGAFVKPTARLQGIKDDVAQRYADLHANTTDAMGNFLNSTFSDGIHSVIPMGGIYVASTGAGTAFTNTQDALPGVTQTVPAGWTATHSGSITGISIKMASTQTSLMTSIATINGNQQVPTTLQLVAADIAALKASKSVPKGNVKFNLGDVLQIVVTSTGAGAVIQATFKLTVTLDPPIPA